MGIIINTNLGSLGAQKNLSKTQAALQQSFNRLSSGQRINSAADDAAGLAVSESMTSQVRSYTVASRNTGDGISMSQTADSALGEMTGVLQRMRDLAMEASNGSLQSTDRSYIQTEFGQLQSEMTRIQTSAKFNGQEVIASASSSVTFQVGISNVASDRIVVSFGGVGLSTLTGTATKLSGAATNAQTALDTIDASLKTISTARSRFGAAVNRFETTQSNIESASLNTSAANSRIRDVDVASETAAMSRNQVLQSAGIAVLSQANASPQVALSLLR